MANVTRTVAGARDPELRRTSEPIAAAELERVEQQTAAGRVIDWTGRTAEIVTEWRGDRRVRDVVVYRPARPEGEP